MRLKLEIFEPVTAANDADEAAAALEEVRLAAFEKGYSAGWDDAAAAEGASQHRIRAEIAHQLQEQAFTYHEARHRALADLEPLIRAMAEVVLPRIARETLVPLIAEAMADVAAGRPAAPVEIRLHPGDAAGMEEMLRAQAPQPFTLVEDDTLTAGQVWLKGSAGEATVDIEDACRRICEVVHNHFHSEPEIRKHG